MYKKEKKIGTQSVIYIEVVDGSIVDEAVDKADFGEDEADWLKQVTMISS